MRFDAMAVDMRFLLGCAEKDIMSTSSVPSGVDRMVAQLSLEISFES
jgi:hypothetical protein